ncbi:MAG: hypothetical protein QOG59_1755 [Solirubrobacteraceae bacterium]|nr:hypothetical protein [Solirubrobacteraceae bacterium]
MTPMRRAASDGRGEQVVRLLTSDRPMGDGGESYAANGPALAAAAGLSRACPPFTRWTCRWTGLSANQRFVAVATSDEKQQELPAKARSPGKQQMPEEGLEPPTRGL